MKKNFFQIIMGATALALGFSSCKKDKKDCKDCATITYDGETDTFCVGDDGLTQTEFNADVAYYKALEYTVKTFQECK